MTEPSGVNKVRISLEQGVAGEPKLTWSCKGVKKEISCKVVPDGILGKVQSAFLMLTQWVSVQSPDFASKHIQVFVQPSDLEMLKTDGFKAIEGSQAGSLPEALFTKIEEFFGHTDVEEMKAEHFAARIQTCLESGGKKLVLDGIFNEKGECPDIFDALLFGHLEDLSLKGIKTVPDTIKHLGSLKSIDLSHSSIITLPKGFAKLKNIEYVNLACSGINKISAVREAGLEYMGASFHEDAATAEFVDQLFQVLKSLPNLKAVNMTSQDRNSQAADRLDGRFSEDGKKGIVKYTEDPIWKT